MKQRIITALCLIPFVLAAIYWLPRPLFNIATGLVVLLAAWEWSALSGVAKKSLQMTYLIGLAVCLCLAYYFADIDTRLYIVGYVALLWLLLFGFIFDYQITQNMRIKQPVILLTIGYFVLSAFWFSLDLLWQWQTTVQPHLILFIMALVWAADSGAYFAGKRFGKHKLAVNVSPGKTWEGVIGGMIVTGLVIVIAKLTILKPLVTSSQLMLVIVVTAIFSVCGDLFESLLKREAGVKDSGKLLPGHGGILDRIDGLLAFLPTIAFLIAQSQHV